MTWDLWALLILVGLSAVALLVVPVWHWGMRVIGWYRVRQFSQCYLPSSASCKPWRQNEWKTERGS